MEKKDGEVKEWERRGTRRAIMRTRKEEGEGRLDEWEWGGIKRGGMTRRGGKGNIKTGRVGKGIIKTEKEWGKVVLRRRKSGES